MTKVISAPGDLVVATSDGVDVRFAGLELTSDIPGMSKHGPANGASRSALRPFVATKPGYEITAMARLYSNG